MAEQSRSDELLKFCMALPPQNCYKLLSESQSRPPKYNAQKVLDLLLNNSNTRSDCGTGMRNLLVRKRQFFTCDNENLLNVVAQEGGALLHDFLLIIQKEDRHFYDHVVKNLKERIYGMPCDPPFPYANNELSIDSRTKLVSALRGNEKELLICPACKLVMSDAILVQCLHSYCDGCCTTKFCDQCRKVVTESQPNYCLRLKIAMKAKEKAAHHNCGDNEESSELEKGFVPKCWRHNDRLTFWCKTCGGYRCEIYASRVCDHPDNNHEKRLARTIARALDPFLAPFAPEDEMSGSAVETCGNAMKKALDDQCEQAQYVLDVNKKRLAEATEMAFIQAKNKIGELHLAQRNVVDGITKQLKQAYMYVKYIRNEYWHVMDQRKMLLEQLSSLFLLTEDTSRSYPSLTQKLCQSFGIPETNRAVESNGLMNSLIVRCLDEKYDFMDVTTELIGQPDIVTAGSISMVRHERTNLSIIEEKTRLLKNNQLRLDEVQQKYDEALTEISRMKAELQVQKSSHEDLRTNSTGQSCDTDRINADNGLEEDRKMRDILRTLWPQIEQSLTVDNAQWVADLMFSDKAINETERRTIRDATGRNAVSKLLEFISARGAKGVLDFRKALKHAELDELAKLLEKNT